MRYCPGRNNAIYSLVFVKAAKEVSKAGCREDGFSPIWHKNGGQEAPHVQQHAHPTRHHSHPHCHLGSPDVYIRVGVGWGVTDGVLRYYVPKARR